MGELTQLPSGIRVRPGTIDEYTVKEVASAYAKVLGRIRPGDLVLDLGAHIGAFSFAAGKLGAKCVAVEAEGENVRMLHVNVPRAIIKHVAVVGRLPEAGASVKFYVNRGSSTSIHSMDPRRGREEVEVGAIEWSTLLGMYQPTVIKSDIEGAELDFDWRLLPRSVRLIAAELHMMRPEWKDKARRVAAEIESMGFVPLRHPNFSTKWSTATGAWERKDA